MTPTTAFVLAPTSTVAEACTAVQQGKLTAPQLAEWLLATPIDTAESYLFFGLFDQPTNKAIMAKQKEFLNAETAAAVAAASSSAKSMAGISVGMGPRGTGCVYGLASRPFTFYKSQALRFAHYCKMPDNSPFVTWFNSNPVKEFELSELAKRADLSDYVAECQRGAHAHAKVVGDKLVVRLASKEA